MTKLFHYTSMAYAERLRDLSSRMMKTWIFILAGMLLIVVAGLVSFVVSMMGIFFKSMILWKTRVVPAKC